MHRKIGIRSIEYWNKLHLEIMEILASISRRWKSHLKQILELTDLIRMIIECKALMEVTKQ